MADINTVCEQIGVAIELGDEVALAFGHRDLIPDRVRFQIDQCLANAVVVPKLLTAAQIDHRIRRPVKIQELGIALDAETLVIAVGRSNRPPLCEPEPAQIA
jgi:hypothetical protein